MDDVARALERAAEAVWEYEQKTGRDIYRSKEGYARAAVLACVQSLPPTMTVAGLAAALSAADAARPVVSDQEVRAALKINFAQEDFRTIMSALRAAGFDVVRR